MDNGDPIIEVCKEWNSSTRLINFTNINIAVLLNNIFKSMYIFKK